MKNLILFIFALAFSPLIFAQNAPWISYPSANQSAYGVYHFRKTFDLEKVPEQLVIHVSADNRYNLFVNGERVCYGPAKGDLRTYKYDVIDIAGYLRKGKNVLAALVYNGGKDKNLSFFSVQTAFMLRTTDRTFGFLDTDNDWKTYKNHAYRVISYDEMLFKNRWFYGFYACGGGDEVFAHQYPWGWESVDFDDQQWQKPELLSFDGDAPWDLVPRNIPFMESHKVEPIRIRKTTGVDVPEKPWNGKDRLVIPARTKASILIDFEIFTMGYPELTVNGGSNSSIRINYAEALYEELNLKAHRDSVNGLTMYGVWDKFHPDGKQRTFRPLWKRTFRYVQFNIETKGEPLEIVSYVNEYSGYPYPEMATFESDNPRLNEIFEMSKRTLRMCSGETYYDTPYYEQMSYGGDNRPISAISTYNTTDDRLLREMLRIYSQSENKETGLYKSAYPSRFTHDQGTWSMAWVQTLRDYFFIRGDSTFVIPFVDNIERVLGYYERHLDEKTGLIGKVRNRNLIDWSITRGSVPRPDSNGEIVQSALLSLYFAHTIDCATQLFNQLGLSEKAAKWERVAKELKVAVYVNCWDEEQQLFRDYPDRQIYSQHTNSLAILCDIIPPVEQDELFHRITNYEGFDEMASSYFSFLVFKVMQKTKQDDLYLKKLDFWYNFLDRGLTTCGETGFASHDRSDCHAWSAHPAYFLLSSVCGIRPADVGFNEVLVEPHLGELRNVSGSVPHPRGKILVSYKQQNNQLRAEIELPEGLSGSWIYKGERIELNEGKNRIIYREDN